MLDADDDMVDVRSLLVEICGGDVVLIDGVGLLTLMASAGILLCLVVS